MTDKNGTSRPDDTDPNQRAQQPDHAATPEDPSTLLSGIWNEEATRIQPPRFAPQGTGGQIYGNYPSTAAYHQPGAYSGSPNGGGYGVGPGGYLQGSHPPQGPSPARRGVLIGLILLAALLIGGTAVAGLYFTGFIGGNSSPAAYGDDPELDALWDLCADGGYADCDELYLLADTDSEYWQLARTCGRRIDHGDGNCVAQLAVPVAYGDDSELDALWDSCAAGNYVDCDELFLLSGAGTEYREFGSTCGDVSQPLDGSCADELAEPSAYGDDSHLDALRDSCAAGNYVDCDELFLLSGAGTEYREFGSTCGTTAANKDGGCEAEFSEPTNYGDDAGLDSLWDACATGDFLACDDLYERSAPGSGYKDFANWCGGNTFDSAQGSCYDQLTTPDGYGDDAGFDSLWDSCAAGDYDACDDLYWATGVGTEYEEFGATCGSRGITGNGHCVDHELDEAGSGDDTALDDLWVGCASGDFAACDDLYFASAIDSDYEWFGKSCGGIAPHKYGGCQDAYGSGIPWSYGDDFSLDGLWDACESGDYASCDELWWKSVISTQYEDFAETCGQRTFAEPDGTCQSRATAGQF